ncbi:MAG TPA: HD domain-containing protein [Aggregatilineaceae bacterium]|nr:HD domain-containing protein [Aggregatilineaceae bacterium]
MITVEFARRLYADDDPVHDFDHVLRVLALARRIGKAEGADMSVVETAVLLHDISRAGEDQQAHVMNEETADHAVVAAEAAREILAAQTSDRAFIEAVAHCIEAHRFRNAIQPQSIEAQTVFDADKLDAIGAIGVARAYAYGGMTRQKLWSDVPPDYAGGGEQHTPYHEYVYKLSRIRERLYTETGRAIARERHAYMAAFFERLAQEIEGIE